MTPDTVCTLYCPGDPVRDENWSYAQQRWQQHGFRSVTGCAQRGLYGSRNVAARAAGDWDAAIFADADIVLADPGAARLALNLARRDGTYVACYDRLHYVTRDGRDRLLAGAPPSVDMTDETVGGVWLGCFAISRPLWEEIGGFDERFAGRPGQDVAFLHAAETLAGVARIDGDAFHIWHEPVSDRPAAHERLQLYAAAIGDREAMTRVLST
jgi:glycosyltransferase involved in cell wall biosynthesis